MVQAYDLFPLMEVGSVPIQMIGGVLEQLETMIVMLGDNAGEARDVILAQADLVGIAYELEDSRRNGPLDEQLIDFELVCNRLYGFI
jgi:hypothetical protein